MDRALPRDMNARLEVHAFTKSWNTAEYLLSLLMQSMVKLRHSSLHGFDKSRMAYQRKRNYRIKD